MNKITKKDMLAYFELDNIKKSELYFVIFIIALSIFLMRLPTGFEKAIDNNLKPVKAKVIDVDNSKTHKIGLIRTGVQYLEVEVLNGKFKGEKIDYINNFTGKLELDKYYEIGDKVFSVLNTKDNEILSVQVIDRYRLNYEIILLGIFVAILVLYAGFTGLKSIVSFFFTAIIIWKVLLPAYLKGYEPLMMSLLITAVLTFVIIFLVAGFSKRALVAFLGAISGVLLTCIFSIFFGSLFKIPGEIKPFSESLLYAGFPSLKLTSIFLSGIFISSSGAVMDIAMDISTSMWEIKEKKPNIGFLELIFSGFKVGRAVTGTMTTTLLLAYSGGFSTLLMVFIVQGVPLANIFNIQYVAGEILHTVVGSFGLVIVAPITAIIGASFYLLEPSKKLAKIKFLINNRLYER